MKIKSNTRIMDPSSTKKPGLIPRRDFLKYLGGGILIIFTPLEACKNMAEPVEVTHSLPKDFNAFLHVSADGIVTCFTGKIEMGQGTITALVQMMADELDVAPENVKMVMGDTALCPWDDGTYGSESVRKVGPIMREAAAEARTVMIQMASKQLKVPVARLTVSNSIITDKLDNSRNISYAQLAKGKKIEKHLNEKPKVKTPSEFKIIGKPYKRTDATLKVTGEAKYTGDIKIPGMMFARIVRPPSYGATLISADTSEAEKIPGILVVRDNDLVALLHESRDKVDEAIVKVNAEFSQIEKDVTDKTVIDHYLKSVTKGNIINSKGDITAGRKLSDKIIESEFYGGYVAHAPMEPHTAAAMIDGDKITVWASAQTPFLYRDEIAKVLKMPAEKVRLITPFVGGGFGGKNYNPQAVEAARITKLSGKPVMLAYTREEEFFYDYFRSAGLNIVKSGIDKDGKITFWDYSAYCTFDRGSDTIYDVPHQKTTLFVLNDPQIHPFEVGAWRGPGNSNHTHAREMQICIMAAKAGMDPLDFRIRNLKDEKMIAVLKAVSDKFGYTPRKGLSGRGYGIACGTDVDTWVALMAEVRVDKNTGHIQVVRVSCAQDMGMCVNPQGTLLQIEGCITMGMGYALTEELQFDGTKMITHNFDTYKIPRFSWVPEINAVILDRMDQPPGGGGEPAIICMGGVIASAVFDATGAILYQMPITPARMLEALERI